MTAQQPGGAQPALEQLATILELNRRARIASDASELCFMAVNDSHVLSPYRQAALWSADQGVLTLSGLVDVDANAPYAQWLNQLCKQLAHELAPRPVNVNSIPEHLSADWDEWFPREGVWLPILREGEKVTLALILGRDMAWTDREVLLLNEWLESWGYAYRQATRGKGPNWRARMKKLLVADDRHEKWWDRRHVRWAAVAVVICLFPVRLTVLAPGELVPHQPSTLRAPLDGVVDAILVQPNQKVKKGQPLFRIDTALVSSRSTAGEEALGAAEAEYRQALQQALFDDAAKAKLPELAGRLEQRRAEAQYLTDQVQRGAVTAPRDGIVLFDDPGELLGRPVVTGERVMRVANPNDAEIEAWVGIADAIPLKNGAGVKLYLDARPLRPLSGKLRYFSHEAVERPDGKYAYRVRAKLDKGTGDIGLKGTAKLKGGFVPAIYWVFRRPIAAARTYLGV
ncbi:MAG TPA: HlyD family efflux transporter periplasmic adaptor subunit [Caulobacteraceae bacterium]